MANLFPIAPHASGVICLIEAKTDGLISLQAVSLPMPARAEFYEERFGWIDIFHSFIEKI
jgi:hypothetical protein